MGYEERRLVSKIAYFEDMLLRRKNEYEIETLRNELTKMRKNLSRLRFESQR